MYVLDTNILIYYGNQEPGVKQAIDTWLANGEALFTSTIVEAELFSWPSLTAEAIQIADEVLSTLTIIPINSDIARFAAFLRRQYNTPLIDALIAATAFLQNAPLVTRNTKDFSKIREIEVLKI